MVQHYSVIECRTRTGIENLAMVSPSMLFSGEVKLRNGQEFLYKNYEILLKYKSSIKVCSVSNFIRDRESGER
ncbi:hypothetical protein P8452_04490 [Trifolium repens]|nr:hypothetical protein P8452_04490 [Trifolium repens]